jgi:hypothetical protein
MDAVLGIVFLALVAADSGSGDRHSAKDGTQAHSEKLGSGAPRANLLELR